jgi:hypothetical protein
MKHSRPPPTSSSSSGVLVCDDELWISGLGRRRRSETDAFFSLEFFWYLI